MLTLVKNATLQGVAYREVLYQLLFRDLKIKYKHTWLGYFWSLLNPIFHLAVLSVVFSHVVRWEKGNYTLYLFSGLVVWIFFQSSVMLAAPALIDNSTFLKKIYLPKFIFPLEKVLFRLLEFLFSLVALGLLGGLLGFPFYRTLLLLPAAISILFLFTYGVSLLAAVLVVYVRDTIHLMAVCLQLLYFATPIIYPAEVLPPRFQAVQDWNPVFVVVRLFQRLIYEGTSPTVVEWSVAAGVGLGVLFVGLWVWSLVDDELLFRL